MSVAVCETARGRRFTCGRQALELGRNGGLDGWSWDDRALIYVSPLSLPERRLRGGMPVCWPWFGAPPAAGLPPHGFLFDSALDIGAPSVVGDTVEVTLTGRFDDSAGFTGAARLTVTYTIEMRRPRLTATVTVENLSDRPIAYGIGFHPYLALPPVDGALRVIAGARRIDVPAMLDEKFDVAAEQVEIRDGERSLWRLGTQSATTVGIWKIDAAKAAAIADLPDDAHPRFICVNPIAPGQSLAAGARRSYATTLEPQAAVLA